MFKQATTTRVAAFFADGLEECGRWSYATCCYHSGIPCDKVSIRGRSLAVASRAMGRLWFDRSLTDEGLQLRFLRPAVVLAGYAGSKNLRALQATLRAANPFVASGRDQMTADRTLH